MRVISSLLLALPALASAQSQIPFVEKAKGWQSFLLSKAVPRAGDQASTTPAAELVPKSFGPNVAQLTLSNWKDTIMHSGTKTPYDSPEAWMVYITGQNKTCTTCGPTDKAFEEAVEFFAKDVSAPRLASIDCDAEEILCGSWIAGTSTIWLFIVPQPAADQSRPATNIYLFPLNSTTVTNGDITKIHTRREYNHMEPYEGPFHPFDGFLAKIGATEPLAHVLYYIGKVPSWAFMIGMSFFSRQYMAKRMVGSRNAPIPLQRAGPGAAGPRR